jgi:hypothetical protein
MKANVANPTIAGPQASSNLLYVDDTCIKPNPQKVKEFNARKNWTAETSAVQVGWLLPEVVGQYSNLSCSWTFLGPMMVLLGSMIAKRFRLGSGLKSRD